MKQVTVPGKEVRYWDFDLETKLEDGATIKGGWNRQATEVNVTVPETLPEALESASNNEARFLEIFARGLTAEAEDRAGQIPDGAFSRAMVAAIDAGYRAMPQFAGMKSGARKPAVMRFVGANEALKNGLAVGFAHLRNAQVKDDSDDSE